MYQAKVQEQLDECVKVEMLDEMKYAHCKTCSQCDDTGEVDPDTRERLYSEPPSYGQLSQALSSPNLSAAQAERPRQCIQTSPNISTYRLILVCPTYGTTLR